MRLIKCYIENFGILHAQSINFSKGLNCCVSQNGSGKTTLTAFIEAMLYGIGDTRRQSLDENPRRKYYPWQGGRFGGSLTLEVGKRRYTVERSFGTRAADDTFRLIDADTGNVSHDYAENIGECLFGIDRDGFLRTVFLSEKNLQGRNDNKTISAKLSDLVGVDGDVAGVDDALRLLEQRRRYYFKKGNTGEIANVRERLAECHRKLDNVTRLAAECREKEARLTELLAQLQSLRALEQEQRRRQGDLSRQRERGAMEDRYAAMLKDLGIEKEKLTQVQRFFAAGVPSTAQVDAMRDAYVESERLKAEALAESGNEEYVALAEYFKNGTSFIEISEMEQAVVRLDEITRELDTFECDLDKYSTEMRTIFPDKAPTKEELEAMEGAARRSGGFLRALLSLVGLMVAAGGALLSDTVGYALIGAGLLVSLLSVIFLKKSKKSKEMLASARKYNGCDCSNLAGIVVELRGKLARYEELASEKEARRGALEDAVTDHKLRLCTFISKFPLTESATMAEAVGVIRARYAHYYALTQATEAGAGSKIEKLRRSEQLSATARDFLSKFPTETSAPFAEIRDKISELTHLTAGVIRLESACDQFAVRYGVTGKTLHSDPGDETAINATLSEIAAKMATVTEEQTLLTRELSEARAELERRDEYEMTGQQLEELYHKHVESLEIIKKTHALLSEACDNITAKYLGKTKERFLEYSRLITGGEGDYTLNTSFELTRTERGEAHGIESYSRGTRDLYALSLRLALLDALYEKESPFIILDDPFLALDDTRLEKAKATLKALGKTRQILYFTCTKARAIE